MKQPSAPAFKSFSHLPIELLHLVLSFSARRFEDLILFTTINTTCKQIADHSILWKQLPLAFYASRCYLMKKWSSITPDTPVIEFMKSRLLDQPTLTKEFFSTETIFPPVLKVEAVKGTTIQRIDERDEEYCYRLRNWFMNFHSEYRRLWYWHAQLHSTFFVTMNEISQMIRYFIYYWIAMEIVVLSIALQCFAENDDQKGGIGEGLTGRKQIGFLLLYIVLFILLIATIFQIIFNIIEAIHYSFTSLKILVRYSLIFGLDMILYAVIGVLFSVVLAHLKLLGVVTRLTWRGVMLPVWIFFTVGYIAFWYGFLIERGRSSDKIFYSVWYAVAMLFSLRLLWYDDPSECLRISKLGWAMLPMIFFYLLTLFILVARY